LRFHLTATDLVFGDRAACCSNGLLPAWLFLPLFPNGALAQATENAHFSHQAVKYQFRL